MENSIVLCLMPRADPIEEKNLNVVRLLALANHIPPSVSEYEDKSTQIGVTFKAGKGNAAAF